MPDSPQSVPESVPSRDRFRRGFLLLLVIAISAAFLAMIRSFLMALFLAAIFSGLLHPVYRRLLGWVRGRQALASVLTLLVMVLLLAGPVSGFLGIVVAQAIEVGEVVRPWVQEQLDRPDPLQELLPDWVPFLDQLQPYRDQIFSKLGEAAGRTGAFLVSSLSALTRGTVSFFFNFFVMLYAMFFFLIDGRSLLDRILYYTPLSPEDKERMLERFVSVTRATIKGTLVIGILQGGLAGLALALAGVKGWAFWSTVMAVLSIIPGVGSALVWVPAVIYLFIKGQTVVAIAVMVWCGAVVGSVDNFLRPWLVGQDTKLPDLLILLSTLGGIFLFGAIGFIVGPILAALFVTVWGIYGAAFRELLEEQGAASGESA